jgi:hypothetical protein
MMRTQNTGLATGLLFYRMARPINTVMRERNNSLQGDLTNYQKVQTIMGKLDTSTGLSTKEIGAFKYKIKNEVGLQLPDLPDHVEMRLFLHGRDAWTYTWNLLNANIPIQENDTISIEVVAKLKKEFHYRQTKTCYKFMCILQRQKDPYHPKLSVTEINA